MTIAIKEVPAGLFKAKCLSLLDDVRDSRQELVITKRGVAVARIVPMEQPRGRMKDTVEVVGDIFSTEKRGMPSPEPLLLDTHEKLLDYGRRKHLNTLICQLRPDSRLARPERASPEPDESRETQNQ